MQVRLPLYAKILLWFFLNLAVLGAVFAFLFDAQFSFSLDWFLTSGARERIDALRDLVIGELDVAPPDEWQSVLQRYSTAHRVRLALLDDEAKPLVSEIFDLPEEVHARILTWSQAGRPRRAFSRTDPSAPSVEAAESSDGSRQARGWRLPLRVVVRTTHPTQYWLLSSGRIDNWLAGDPLRVVLVAQSDSISAGGLIFDPRPWLALGLGAVVFSLLFWFPLVHGITRAVGKMRHATRQIADGRFDVRVAMRRRDELGALGDSIDQMAARLDGFVKGQKRFLGDIAHELCSPLARLQIALGILEQRAEDGQAAHIRSATEKAEQISSLVSELLSFSKASYGAPTVRMQAVNLHEAAEQAVAREDLDAAEVSLEIPLDLQVSADPDLLIRALANLLRNASRAVAGAGAIIIRASRNGDDATITVIDSGPGLPDEEMPKIFDAFYRVDSSRTRETGGTGLGLAIVKACIESCGGSVFARAHQPHGLEVVITLRVADEQDDGSQDDLIRNRSGQPPTPLHRTDI
jgi:two-component system sensor histidine kinase CpxA